MVSDRPRRQRPTRIDLRPFLTHLLAYQYAYQRCPSQQELTDRLGLPNRSMVNHRVALAERLGYITRVPGIARSMVVTDAGRAFLQADDQTAKEMFVLTAG